MSFEITDKKYWDNINPDSFVTLTDQIALDASKLEGRGLAGMEYSVPEILHIIEKDNLCDWYILSLVHPKQQLFLVAKLIGKDISLRVFYQPDAVISGTRKEQIDAQNLFMFRETKNYSEYLNLLHTQQIAWTITSDDQEKIVNFNQKGNMELTGKAIYKPNRINAKKMIATVSEYIAEIEVDEPEMIILEVGDISNKDGGVMKLLVGNSINQFDISILNAKGNQDVPDVKPFSSNVKIKR